MLPVARRNLLAEKTRLLMSVTAVASAVMLILLIQGLYQGFVTVSGAFVRTLPTDIWVVEAGSIDLFHSASVLPLGLVGDLKDTPGVNNVLPGLGRNMGLEINGARVVTYMFASSGRARLRPSMMV